MKTTDMDHLARITMANLPKGKMILTQDEIIEAMTLAVAKENVMCQQLLTDDKKLSAFTKIITPMAWDSIHA